MGVRETGGTEALWPKRGFPESDWARERISCWAAVCVEVEEMEGGGGVSRPVSGEESNWRERAAV